MKATDIQQMHQTLYHEDLPDDKAQAVAEVVNKYNAPNMETQLCITCDELVPEGCCTCGPRQRLQPLEQPNKYAHLVGLTYPDAQGRMITVLDVDPSGRALMERGGSYWGCEAEYLEEIKAEMEAAR